MINAIVFDVDDTLYDQQAPFKNAIANCFPAYFSSLDLTRAYLRFRYHSDETFCKYISGEWTLDYMRFYRIREVLKEQGYSLTEDQGLLFQENYETELNSIQLLPEAKELLNALASKSDIQIGIITNGPTDHQSKKIQQLQLERWIPAEKMIISESSGFAKPDRRIFDLAARQFKFEPSTTLYIGDNYDNDVNGAKEAGWQAFWFNHRKREKPVSLWSCDEEITEFHEFPSKVLSLLD
ncbi:HAD family hydrolase [Carnobacterium maltaromaticum]|uniref:HAD-superhydrolase, subIA, variant 1 family protein n=1 Tax=Carnobacterium maltaromaticum LMA28 TaxID=1234679 RepID=K8EHU9_CARML|nr:HAD family hydrolase [Carnobacterium maltaromaticum]AOA02212.1 HAD family hydrolase [Carnobacterium maltaromaticum]KRN65724.1 hypothetical protein IV70_GL002237 [Carnobacterium maltaromaticum DSM 20342]MCI1819476.1 HAD family hydrolase [Carnobacterium maltaromaticum]CCO11378.2 HAD-superhydrolase, subIA, variant 1 family protein [Carnobacterium maltaromaticum LMA28]